MAPEIPLSPFVISTSYTGHTMNTMNFGTEHFGDFPRTSWTPPPKFAKVGFDSTERFFALNMETTKVGFEETTKNTKGRCFGQDDTRRCQPARKTAETGLEFLVGYAKISTKSATPRKFSIPLVEERVSAFKTSR